MKRNSYEAARHLGIEVTPAFLTTSEARSVGGRRARILAAALLAIGMLGASAVHAEIYVVDNTSPACSDSGEGSSWQPYCSINAAVNARREPGTTILVMPGIYREQVNVPETSAGGLPVSIRALSTPAHPVVVDGADEFGDPSQWTPAIGDIWLSTSVTWEPRQVFADGARLRPSNGQIQDVLPGSFRYEPGMGLYVNVGGSNPASRAVSVGHRQYGFLVSKGAIVSIEGFSVLRSEDRGIQLKSGSHDVTVLKNEVRWAGRVGIQATACSAVTIRANKVWESGGHGIALTGGTTGSTVQENESFRNVHPEVRSANGIYLASAHRNVIRGNRLHENQDTGLQIQTGSSFNTSIQNVSWRNGDHGLDDLHSHDNLHIGDVAYGNFKDGFSFEGNSPRNRLYNSIAVDNGLTTKSYNLFVDSTGSVGFVADDNIFWNSTAQAPIQYRGVRYESLADYATVSGNDTRSLQADPKFLDALTGDFRLTAGSRAIDNANTSIPGWPTSDDAGRPRFDDPRTTNQGLGPIAYADRGAFEYWPLAGTLVSYPPGDQQPSTQAVAAAAPFHVGMFPNPMRSGGRLVFTHPSPGPVTVRVFDMQGREVRKLDHPGGTGDFEIPIETRGRNASTLHAGVYFYRIQLSDGERSGRFVVVQ